MGDWWPRRSWPYCESHFKRSDLKRIDVRGIDEELANSIRLLAEREGISLSQAAMRLLRKGAGLTDRAGGQNSIGSSLDDLFGTWSREDAEVFNSALHVFETVDESAWK